MTYLYVADLERAENETAEAGGSVLRSTISVPGVGKLAVVTDATGALIGLIEPEKAESRARAH